MKHSDLSQRRALVFPGNRAEAINTLLTPFLAALPPGAFQGFDRDGQDPRPLVPERLQQQLAFRNLARASMVRLASGQQVAKLCGEVPLQGAEVLQGSGGADLKELTPEESTLLAEHTPLWFYILREAEVRQGRCLGPVGSRIVVETFHRMMEAGRHSILRDPSWRPLTGSQQFQMKDLLRIAVGNEGLSLLGQPGA